MPAKRYYIEAMMKEGNGDDHLAVGWQKPGDTAISVIAGTYLSPYLPVIIPRSLWNFDESAWNGTSGRGESHRRKALFVSMAPQAMAQPPPRTIPRSAAIPARAAALLFNGTSQSVIVPFNTSR
jgi:hypothetical protein